MTWKQISDHITAVTLHTHYEQHDLLKKSFLCYGVLLLVEINKIKLHSHTVVVLKIIALNTGITSCTDAAINPVLRNNLVITNLLWESPTLIHSDCIIRDDKWLWGIIKRLEWSFISVWLYREQFPPTTVWIPVLRAWWMAHCASPVLATGWW